MYIPEAKIISASFHRNGVGGEGFYAILFDESENGRMVAALFDTPGHCAIFQVEELAKGNILFAQGNSWRGDCYEAVLRPALDEYLNEEGTNRFGPFAFPQSR